MFLRIGLLLCLLFGGWQAASAGVIRIADGDCTGLSNAVTAAQTANGTTTILLARKGNYAGCDISTSAGSVVVDGQGAQITGFSACVRTGGEGGSPYMPTPAASLTIRNLSVVGSNGYCPNGRVGTFGGFPIGTVFLNTGTLLLESVTMHDVNLSGFINGLMLSSGTLVLRNVTIANVAQYVGGGSYYLQGGTSGALISSSGRVEIYNSTFSNNSARVDSDVYPILDGGDTVIVNSLFSNPSPACRSPATALRGNVAGDDSCGFSAGTGDKIVQNAGLGAVGNHGGLIPTAAIGYSSPAHGAGVAQYCEALDARSYTRSPHGCDAGAYEYGGGSGALTQSGMNGVFYDPDANGHYVSIQRVRDNGDVTVLWSTFDANGNQAWVYGVGQVSGKHIHAAMSQNVGGVLQAGGPPTGSSVRPWGTVDIDLTSCVLAQFNYASALDGFGSGQFPLTRLAYVSDFGCAE